MFATLPSVPDLPGLDVGGSVTLAVMGEFSFASQPANQVFSSSLPWPQLPRLAPMPKLLDATKTAVVLPTVAPEPPPVEPLWDLEHQGLLGPHRLLWLPAYHQAGLPDAVSALWLRREVAVRLVRAAAALPEGFGLVVWDGWRSESLQSWLYHRAYADANLPEGFVTKPSADPATPPPHATGGTVDLTLSWRGIPLGLGTEFDEFVPQAFAAAFEAAVTGADRRVRDLRRLLRQVLVQQGFVGLAREWWHFEYGTRLWAAVTSQTPRYRAVNLPAVR